MSERKWWSQERALAKITPHLIVPSLSIILGLAVFVDKPLTLAGWQNTEKEDVFRAFVVSALGAIIQAMVSAILSFRKVRLASEQAMKAGRATESLIGEISQDTVKITRERRNVLSYTDQCFRTIGDQCLKAITDGFDFGEKIVLKGEFLAYEGYRFFLEYFLTKQRHDGGTLEIRAVHSTPIHVWLDRRGEQYLRIQRDFIQAGGKVCRIVVGPQPMFQLRQSDAYVQAIRKMLNAKITVFYVDRISLTEVGITEIHNFLWVEDGDYLFRWMTHSEGKRIRKAVIRTKDAEVQESTKTWGYIMNAMEKKDFGVIDSHEKLDELINGGGSAPHGDMPYAESCPESSRPAP